jgi:hypothetical protein
MDDVRSFGSFGSFGPFGPFGPFPFVLVLSAAFAGVKYSQDHDVIAGVAILEDVDTSEHLQHNLSVLFTSGDRPTELRMSGQKVRSRNDRVGDGGGELRRLSVKKEGEAIEVGEGIVRPLNVYGRGHGWNRGVPHVRSQRTTRSCGTVGFPASIFFQRRSSSAISSGSTAIGSVSSVASSETKSETLTPSSAARVCSTSAVCSSTSILMFAPIA